MAEQQIPKAICIYQQSLTASAAKVSIGVKDAREIDKCLNKTRI